MMRWERRTVNRCSIGGYQEEIYLASDRRLATSPDILGWAAFAPGRARLPPRRHQLLRHGRGRLRAGWQALFRPGPDHARSSARRLRLRQAALRQLAEASALIMKDVNHDLCRRGERRDAGGRGRQRSRAGDWRHDADRNSPQGSPQPTQPGPSNGAGAPGGRSPSSGARNQPGFLAKRCSGRPIFHSRRACVCRWSTHSMMTPSPFCLRYGVHILPPAVAPYSCRSK